MVPGLDSHDSSQPLPSKAPRTQVVGKCICNAPLLLVFADRVYQLSSSYFLQCLLCHATEVSRPTAIACMSTSNDQSITVSSSISSHSSDLLLIHILLEALVEVFPPCEQERIANELEPRCELQLRIFEHRLQTISSNVSSVADFVQVGLEVNICLDEENVIDWVGHTTSVNCFCRNEIATYSRARPISHHLVPCSGYVSRI